MSPLWILIDKFCPQLHPPTDSKNVSIVAGIPPSTHNHRLTYRLTYILFQMANNPQTSKYVM